MYHLVWEDLTVVVTKNLRKGATKKLLNGLSGFAQSNRIMAIMGPSGSGKSTLLDALAGIYHIHKTTLSFSFALLFSSFSDHINVCTIMSKNCILPCKTKCMFMVHIIIKP